jgi:hypothetical protein
MSPRPIHTAEGFLLYVCFPPIPAIWRARTQSPNAKAMSPIEKRQLLPLLTETHPVLPSTARGMAVGRGGPVRVGGGRPTGLSASPFCSA